MVLFMSLEMMLTLQQNHVLFTNDLINMIIKSNVFNHITKPRPFSQNTKVTLFIIIDLSFILVKTNIVISYMNFM
jgi:hypothetical protein